MCFDFFLSGRGSVLNSIGEVEMDAVIMDGETLSSGAVACVQNIANPVKLARMVMEKVTKTKNKYIPYCKLKMSNLLNIRHNNLRSLLFVSEIYIY